MTELFGAFSYDFFLRAFTVGILLSAVCAFLGNFVVIRREAIVTHTLSHAALLGIALGILFQVHFYISVLFACVIALFFIVFFRRMERFSSDSILELIAQISMAGAIVLMSSLKGFRGDIMQYLFGDILAVSERDVLLTFIVSFAVVVFLLFYRRKMMEVILSEELAVSKGTNVVAVHVFFLLILAVMVSVSIKIIGVILLSAFLVIPANTAKVFAENFRQMVIYSIFFGVFGTIFGLFASYFFDAPSGAAIVLSLAVLFLGSNVLAMGRK